MISQNDREDGRTSERRIGVTFLREDINVTKSKETNDCEFILK